MPGPKQSLIEKLLKETYAPIVFEIENESDSHSGPKGRESHFKVLIVSRIFEGLSRVEAQRHVFKTLSEVMPTIHAFALRAQTPEAYKKENPDFMSPSCASRVKD
jgi:stress-induced morphogen